MKLTIKEGQNIFDAILASSGSVQLGLEFLVVGNQSDVLNWDVETGDVIESGTDEILDFIVLQTYKKKGHLPVNGETQLDDFNGDFNNDFNAGGVGNYGIGIGQIGLTFTIG
tara:strand:- start:612 stop:947 length:336 start_codon:yes stop_codon:yes gene_type:complete